MLMATSMVKAGTDPLLCTTCHSVERSCPYKKETHKLPVAVQLVKRIYNICSTTAAPLH